MLKSTERSVSIQPLYRWIKSIGTVINQLLYKSINIYRPPTGKVNTGLIDSPPPA